MDLSIDHPSDEDDLDEYDDSDHAGDVNEGEIESKLAVVMAQKFLLPPTPDDFINKKWFSVVYAGKRRRRMLIVGIFKFQMKFLKPKVGSEDILEDFLVNLPDCYGNVSAPKI